MGGVVSCSSAVSAVQPRGRRRLKALPNSLSSVARKRTRMLVKVKNSLMDEKSQYQRSKVDQLKTYSLLRIRGTRRRLWSRKGCLIQS